MRDIFNLKTTLLIMLFICLMWFDNRALPVSPEHLLSQLSLDEKIGQLIMAAAVSNEKINKAFIKRSPYTMDTKYVENLIKNYHIGGIIFLGTGTTKKQISLTKHFQQMSSIPLLIGQDLEWGLSMRLQNTVRFPHAMTLGALPEAKDSLIYELGREIGRQCKTVGVHINFAPVADVNNNPNNPIINDRSFGENQKQVARKATLFMHGLQDAGIIACAKHFPGHGDTAVDSHHDLPCILHTREHLDAIELYPFRQLINNGVKAVMTAHLALPTLEQNKKTPASLSYAITTQLLQKELGFNGLVVTDGLGMRGVTKNFAPGALELQAIRAGNDLLVAPVDVPKAITTIKQAVLDGTLPEQELDQHVLKILQAKEWALQQRSADHEQNLHSPYAYELKKKLYSTALTLVKNENNLVPIQAPPNVISVITIGNKANAPFISELSKHLRTQDYVYNTQPIEEVISTVQQSTLVILAVHTINRTGMIELRSTKKSSDHGSLITKLIDVLNKQGKDTILVSFGSPYSLRYVEQATAIIAAYENDPDAQTAAAQILVGKITPTGKLPVTASNALPAGLGL